MNIQFDNKIPSGLEKVFKIGEGLPWKKIWFEVESVTPNKLTLRPMRTTSGFDKNR